MTHSLHPANKESHLLMEWIERGCLQALEKRYVRFDFWPNQMANVKWLFNSWKRWFLASMVSSTIH